MIRNSGTSRNTAPNDNGRGDNGRGGYGRGRLPLARGRTTPVPRSPIVTTPVTHRRRKKTNANRRAPAAVNRRAPAPAAAANRRAPPASRQATAANRGAPTAANRGAPPAANRGAPAAAANRGAPAPAPPPPLPPRDPTMVNPSAVRRALVAATTTRPRSQQQALDPLAEEEAFDQSTYPGGDVDSEAEDGEDSEAENAALDRMIHAEDTIAVAEDDEFIESSPASFSFVLTGCPPGWKPPTAPADWEAPAHREEWGEPAFADVDNPGDWSSFTFRPRFKKGKKKEDGMVYSYHAMPAGATPVPINPETGCQPIGDWSFFYKGWERDFDSENNKHHLLHGIPVFRSGADRSDMFPDCRKGSLSGRN